MYGFQFTHASSLMSCLGAYNPVLSSDCSTCYWPRSVTKHFKQTSSVIRLTLKELCNQPRCRWSSGTCVPSHCNFPSLPLFPKSMEEYLIKRGFLNMLLACHKPSFINNFTTTKDKAAILEKMNRTEEMCFLFKIEA